MKRRLAKGKHTMLQQERAAILLIDVQEKLWRVMHDKERLLEHLVKLVKGATVLGLPMLWFEQNPRGLGATMPELAALLTSQTPLTKRSFSCCGHAAVFPELERLKCDQILLAGIEAHICVYQTGVELRQRGYDTRVVTDAVSSRTPENKQLGIECLKQAGCLATGVEMALFELLKTAEGAAFKDILNIVK